MYKIIFLDDEAMTLKLLEHALDWQQYGIELCGAAGDGEEGIALFREVEPDIVITDIRMPRMNGIELAAALRQTSKQVKILLLSAYAEFEYAHSAITYEISEYLLKPLDEDKLAAAMGRVVQELDRAQAVSSTIESYRLEQVEKQLQQFLLAHPTDARAHLPDALCADLRAACGPVDTLLACLCAADPQQLALPASAEPARLALKARLGPTAAVAAAGPVELVVLCGELPPGVVEAALHDLRRAGFPLVVGLAPLAAAAGVGAAYQAAAHARAACFYTGASLCRSSPALPAFACNVPFSLALFEPPIRLLVEQGKADALQARLQEQLADRLRLRAEPQAIQAFVFAVLDWMRLALTRQHPAGALPALGTISPARLQACADATALGAYLYHLLQTLGADAGRLLAADPGSYVVGQAKAYTREHYGAMTFSLEEVAGHVGLSKNHFSQLFHKATGQKFWDYVTELRIEKAKELLKQSNCAHAEICRTIGYESEFYFSKAFKRATGVSPQQYRKL
jgi:two-component system response regulator YesN